MFLLKSVTEYGKYIIVRAYLLLTLSTDRIKTNGRTSMPSLKQIVYEKILDEILDGAYPVDYVFTEMYFVNKFQTSRAPVRDALMELCNEKILRVIPRYGYELVKLTENDVREITQFRLMLEIESFKLSVASNRAKLLEQISLFNAEQRLSQSQNDYNSRSEWQKNIRFHTMLMSFANNHYAQFALQQALLTLQIAYAQHFKKVHSSPESTAAEADNYHYLLESAIRENDTEKALQILHDDICDISRVFRSDILFPTI